MSVPRHLGHLWQSSPCRMAMYYYASKISAVACGSRCSKQTRRKPVNGGKNHQIAFRGPPAKNADDMEDDANQLQHLSDKPNLDDLLHKKWNDDSVSHEKLTLALLTSHVPSHVLVFNFMPRTRF